ncbi:MAG: hypothetical protein ACYS6W_06185 [Planctomycetota bacterium]|jgi:hypothetical protein
MGPKKAAFYLLAIMLGGCVLSSLHPLYTDKELIYEEKLIGKWSDGNNIWEFRAGEPNTYQMRVLDEEGKEGRFAAHLVKLENMLFLDIFPDGETLGEPQAFYSFHLLPTHTFMKVEQIEPKLQLRMMDYDKVSKILKENPNLLKHEDVEDRIVLTASTEQLQKFIIKYANEGGVFADEAAELTRRQPLYTKEDLVFDESLTGVWEGKDGEILDSIRMKEKAYDMKYIDKDGTELQFFANLVELKGMTFLALFGNKSSAEDKDSNGLQLIPDWLVLVDEIEPLLQVQLMNYEKVSELVKDPNSRKQETEETNPVFVFERICCGPDN